jgi:hypothetical protein
MKFNIEKIMELKNPKDIEKININKPLFYKNYLFHYLIMFDKLDLLKIHKHSVFNFNEDKLDGFMLAAKYDNFKILEYLLKEYPEYSQNHNEDGLNFINFINKPKKLIQLMKKFENINWQYLLKFKNQENIEYYKYLLSELNNDDLNWFLKKYNNFNSYYTISAIILNEKLKTSEKIKIFDTFTEKQINDKNFENQGIIVDIINLEDIKLVDYFIKRNIDLEYIFKPTTLFISPMFFLITKIFTEEQITKFEEILEIIMKKIKLDYLYINRDGINYVQLVLNLKLQFPHFKSKVVEKVINTILSESPDESWRQINLNKENALFYIVKLPFKKYIDFIKNRKLDLKQTNSKNETIIDIAEEDWKKEINKLKQYVEKDNIDIKIEKNKYQHQTKFTATMIDIIVYFIYLSKKYKNLFIPHILDSNMREDFPWVINYSPNKIDIHPNLNYTINKVRREGNYDFVLLFLAFNLEDNLKHANILLYDFKNLSVERFEPYGNDDINMEVDDILDEELTWNTGLKYLKPSDYLPKPGYQLLSNENDMEKQKVGDFGGFCLGWCIWYVEHRIKNNKIDPKTLNKKTLEKLLHMDNNLNEFIRNYSNKLFDEKYKIMKNICINDQCIPEKNISNIYLSNNDQNIIISYAEKFFGTGIE